MAARRAVAAGSTQGLLGGSEEAVEDAVGAGNCTGGGHDRVTTQFSATVVQAGKWECCGLWGLRSRAWTRWRS